MPSEKPVALLPCPKCDGTGYMGVAPCDCETGYITRPPASEPSDADIDPPPPQA